MAPCRMVVENIYFSFLKKKRARQEALEELMEKRKWVKFKAEHRRKLRERQKKMRSLQMAGKDNLKS